MTSKSTFRGDAAHRPLSIREATSSDVPVIRDIYNHYVSGSTATFAMQPETLDERREWFAQHEKHNLPVIVAELDGKVIAWASLSFYHQRCGYRQTAEPSVYVAAEHLGKGYGRQLAQTILAMAEEKGYHCLVCLVCSENSASINLLAELGFEKVGELKEVGKKFDRWLNVTILEKLF